MIQPEKMYQYIETIDKSIVEVLDDTCYLNMFFFFIFKCV